MCVLLAMKSSPANWKSNLRTNGNGSAVYSKMKITIFSWLTDILFEIAAKGDIKSNQIKSLVFLVFLIRKVECNNFWSVFLVFLIRIVEYNNFWESYQRYSAVPLLNKKPSLDHVEAGVWLLKVALCGSKRIIISGKYSFCMLSCKHQKIIS